MRHPRQSYRQAGHPVGQLRREFYRELDPQIANGDLDEQTIFEAGPAVQCHIRGGGERSYGRRPVCLLVRSK